MTMRMKHLTEKDVQIYRCDNYVHHFNCRNLMKVLMYTAPGVLKHYQNIAQLIKPPALNAFGCDSYNDEQWQYIVKVANAEKLDAGFLISWYLSDDGWRDLQEQWFELPEVTPELCRQLAAVQRRIADDLVMERE